MLDPLLNCYPALIQAMASLSKGKELRDIDFSASLSSLFCNHPSEHTLAVLN